jgi:hypothetical protein
MDYGADAKGYVDAFFANLRSHEVDRRLGSMVPGGCAASAASR